MLGISSTRAGRIILIPSGDQSFAVTEQSGPKEVPTARHGGNGAERHGALARCEPVEEPGEITG